MSDPTDQSPESDNLDPKAGADGGAESLAEPDETGVPAAEAQLAELTDRHLRLAAEYDNFRRRTSKERAELWAKAQADLLSRIVDALDDLTRFGRVDSARTDPNALIEGVNLVERKFWKELEGAGLRRVDQVGVAFDPKVHEAVTTAPAADPSEDHTIGAILQAGYKLGDLLIRPARVQVLTWQGAASRGAEQG